MSYMKKRYRNKINMMIIKQIRQAALMRLGRKEGGGGRDVWGAGSGRRLRRSRGERGGGGGGKKDRAGTDLCGAHNFHNAILCSDFLSLW